MNALRWTWDIIKRGHARLIREIAEYPNAAFWIWVSAFFAYAIWRR